MRTPPPSINQKSWMNFFGEPGRIDRSQTFSIPDDLITTASFSNDNEYLVAGSQNGVIMAWNLRSHEQVFHVSRNGCPITCCIFSLKNSLVLCSCENIILLYDFQRGEYLSQFMNDVRTTSLLVVPYAESKIVAISDKSVSVWQWKQRHIDTDSVRIYEPQRYVLSVREDAHYLCGAVTWDGVYLVAGASDHSITMWNLETRERVKEMLEHNGLVVSLDTFLNDESNSNVMYILLSGSDNKTVKQWHIHEVETTNKTCKLRAKFSACWKHGPIPLIAAINSEKRVQVFSGHALISESDALDQPECLAFSPCGTRVAIGLSTGLVRIFDFRSKQYRSVMDLEGPVNYIEYLVDSNTKDDHTLIAASDNTCLMAYKHSATLRFKNPESQHIISKGKASKTIKCFLLSEAARVLSVEQNGSIKVWYLNGIEDVLVVREPNSTVTMATMSVKKDLIAMTFSDKNFRIYKLHVAPQGRSVSCEFSQGKLLDDVPRCCCFSRDGRLLAVGQDSGNIVVS